MYNDIIISCSIVLYNNSKKQLYSLFGKIDIPCIAVDNSQTNILKTICDEFPSVSYIHQDKNLGFGKAHNKAFKILKDNKSLGKYHLIINPDVDFEKNTIDLLVEYMDKHKDIGTISPKILNIDGTLQPQCRLLPTAIDMIKRRLLNKKELNRFNKIHELRVSSYDKIFTAPFIQGSFWLVRSELYEKLNGFDERFFLYMEDLDFCRRMNEVSSVTFYPYAHVKHEWQKGSSKNLKLLAFHTISMVKYFNKWGWFTDKKKDELNKNALMQFNPKYAIESAK